MRSTCGRLVSLFLVLLVALSQLPDACGKIINCAHSPKDCERAPPVLREQVVTKEKMDEKVAVHAMVELPHWIIAIISVVPSVCFFGLQLSGWPTVQRIQCVLHRILCSLRLRPFCTARDSPDAQRTFLTLLAAGTSRRLVVPFSVSELSLPSQPTFPCRADGTTGSLSPLPFISLASNCTVWTLYGWLKQDNTGAPLTALTTCSCLAAPLVSQRPSVKPLSPRLRAVLLPNSSGLCIGLYFTCVFAKFSAKPIGARKPRRALPANKSGTPAGFVTASGGMPRDTGTRALMALIHPHATAQGSNWGRGRL